MTLMRSDEPDLVSYGQLFCFVLSVFLVLIVSHSIVVIIAKA